MPESSNDVIRIPPNYYIHILDQNTNVTRLEIGPKNLAKQDHEKVVREKTEMIIVPPMSYCIIENPVIKINGEIQKDKYGQVKLAHSDREVRLSQQPFPLYPGEALVKSVEKLKIVPSNSALSLIATIDFTDSNNVDRTAGDEWLFTGPGTYIPRKEETVTREIQSSIILANQALKLKAKRKLVDSRGVERVSGEEWLIKTVGSYLPGVYEEVVCFVEAVILTEKKALHLRALKTFVDDYKIKRKTGEEWLVTSAHTEAHIPHVYEEVVGMVDITTLNNRQYCVILDPADEKCQPQFGRKKLVCGEKSFFLLPCERLERGIQNMYILSENEGLILRANEEHLDATTEEVRRPGDLWMIQGPAEFVPSVEVEVVRKHTAIPLDENEGVYVRNVKTGQIRAVFGHTYMLTQEEELWAKELPPTVEALLSVYQQIDASSLTRPDQLKRDKSRVVFYRVPHNAAVQVYDYKAKKARVVFGPQLVMLAPDEQFTQLSLSGSKPKKPNVVKALYLLLGPEFSTDIITVETADHARLSLQLSYNWHFDVNFEGFAADQVGNVAAQLFSVPDFVGDMCKAVASRIRGAVASVNFDDFHRNSAKIIRVSVFGLDENQKVRKHFVFEQNRLIITNIDIQSVEPVDERTRDSLLKSVQLAIEITTSSVEATARHEAERLEQEARGRLERQKILDEAEAEKSRRNLLELRALSEAVASTGQAKAEAQSHAEAARIEGETAVEQAKLRAAAQDITANSELERLKNAREDELNFSREQNLLEMDYKFKSTELEVLRYQQMVEAIGSQTLLAISKAKPETEVRLLQALNLQSTLITDGTSPINLFTTAHGLLGNERSA